MAASSISDYLYQLKEFWSVTPPREMWDGAGHLCMLLQKKVRTDWAGTGIAKVGVKSSLSGKVGANVSRAYSSVSSSGKVFEVPGRNLYVFMNIDEDLLEFGTRNGTVSGQDARMEEAKATTASYMRAKSYLLWSDGTGRIGKGDGAYNIAGDTIVFKNARSAAQFEEGDEIVLIDQAAAVPPSGMPAYRAFAVADTPPVVIAVGSDSIQLDQNVSTAIPTAANTDYISKWVYFDGSRQICDGVFRWVPLTATESVTTWAGVNRATNTNRLAGRRVQLSGSETPYAIIGKLGIELKNARGALTAADDYGIFVPSNEIGALTQEASANGVRFESVTTGTDPRQYTMGVQVVRAQWPGLGTVNLIADHFLHDPNVSVTNDKTYVLMNMNDFHYGMTATGISFKVHEDNGGILKAKPGTDEYYAQYGSKGNLFCAAPGHQIVASTRAAL